MTVNHEEDRVVGNCDRMRGKAGASVRKLQIRDQAKAAARVMVEGIPQPDLEPFVKAAVTEMHAIYQDAAGARATVSLFGSLSNTPLENLSRAVAAARGEQLFTFKAANDGDDQ